MYTFLQYRYTFIMFWFYFTISAVIIIFAPIVLQVSFFGSKNAKKVYFSVYLFGMIKLISGYVTFAVDKAYVHLTKKFAVEIPYKDAFGSRKKISGIKGIEILSIKNELNFANLDLFNQVMLSSACMYIYSVLITILSQIKPFVNITCGVKQQKNADLSNLFDVVVAFNVFVLIKIGLKKLLGVINEKKQVRNSYQTST